MSEIRYVLPQPDSELESLVDVQIAPEPLRSPHVGEIVSATLRAVADETLTLTSDDGLHIYVPVADALLVGDDTRPQPGSRHEVLLESEADDETWEGSIARARALKVLEDILVLANSEEPIDAIITVALRNGFAAEYNGLRCFIPARESGIPRHEALDHVGKTYTFDVKDFDQKTCQLVLTRKERADAQRREAKKEAFARLNVGDLVTGTVRNMLGFGAFVDIGGIEGLLHISEASLHPIDHPSQVLTTGEEIEVKIKSLDESSYKIGLSRRALLMDEQRKKLARLVPQMIYDGVVKSIVEFGAFIEIGDGIEGLCHVSELRWTEHVQHPSEVLEVGEEVQVRLLAIDADENRLSLSIRQVDENPWTRFVESTPTGTVVEGTITRVEDYGIFVEIAEGIEGLCHISDLTWEGRPETPADVGDFIIGDKLEVKVLEIDVPRQRIGLGLKQLSADPWDNAGDRVKEGTIFTAPITRFGNDAAYLEVAPGVEGRLHISQVSTERIDSIRGALHFGQEVEVMTVQADQARRRLDVSIRAIEEKRLAEQPTSFDDGEATGALADALKAGGFKTTRTVESTDSDDAGTQPSTSSKTLALGSSEDAFSTDADLIEGFQAQVKGLGDESAANAEDAASIEVTEDVERADSALETTTDASEETTPSEPITETPHVRNDEVHEGETLKGEPADDTADDDHKI